MRWDATESQVTSNRAEIQVLEGGTLGSTSPLPPFDVVEPWCSSLGELLRSPLSPGHAIAPLLVIISKCPSEKEESDRVSLLSEYVVTSK
ncbi:jg25900 [Pararge aegeria aegeria]|uniref:Jg25900 protein n=1 Tax=Pararge aegeria aegeria TaxID=348720 RepID=A0A8S4QXI0_9NEOP|nr:jg25900 [Pararge aegeria aegeria]